MSWSGMLQLTDCVKDASVLMYENAKALGLDETE